MCTVSRAMAVMRSVGRVSILLPLCPLPLRTLSLRPTMTILFSMVVWNSQSIGTSHAGNQREGSIDQEAEQGKKQNQPWEKGAELTCEFCSGALAESLSDESERDHRPTTSGD